MPIPNLIHPVSILLSQIEYSTTDFDEEFREPVQNVNRAVTQTIPGQVKWAHDKKVFYMRQGKKLEADGYVLFRYVDLSAKTVTLNIGDRILQTGKQNLTNVYIVHLQPIGHYTDTDGSTMVKAFFEDKDLVRKGATF